MATTPPLPENELALLRRAISLAKLGRDRGCHPFGSLLTDPEGNILLETHNTYNIDKECTSHAETNLMRQASAKYGPEFLSKCTIFTSTEPCAMCAGAIYWGNVLRVVYSLRESELFKMTGVDERNMTLNMPCREVFAKGRKNIVVVGPVLEEEGRRVHDGFWKNNERSGGADDGK